MSRRVFITRGAWILLGLSAILAGVGFALPHLRPVPDGVDAALVALRGERDALATNDDATLENLRRQSRAQPPVAWSAEKFAERVGTGWRIEWQQPDGASRTVLLSRSAPRLHEWPDYFRFLKSWTDRPGIVLESLDVTAKGAAQTRELGQVVIGLRVALTVAPIRNAERDSPSLVPLPVAAAVGAAATRTVGPGPSLRRPAASAEPPAPGQDSAPVRPDPPGPRAADFSPSPQQPKP
ncbi:MAG: hypothetical protein F9K30_21195 [Dechloromonas sp.]|nr:MAG: hypothetical protein F9K30_21195 [Dechloromonas sp.]